MLQRSPLAYVPGELWNPLGDLPLPEYVPPKWNAPHVFIRTSDAFSVLARCPRGKWVPTAPHTLWPQCEKDFESLVIMLDDGGGAFAEWRQERLRVRDLPSAAELSRMERALGWPGRFLRGDAEMVRMLNLSAMCHAQGRDLADVLKQYRSRRRSRVPFPRLSEGAVRKMGLIAADVIARGLVRVGDPVF